jgi:hypothetical protein
MFGFAKIYKKIQVRFYELDAVEPFAQSTLPIEQLPDTFQVQTTLHLGSDDWVVREATPPTKAEFRKSGRVAIRLYKPKQVSVLPTEILYSLPTISNDLPNRENRESLENVFVVHEDDWRQVELISDDKAELIKEEMASIRKPIDTQRVSAGFKTIHVRKLIPSPLGDQALRLTHVTREFSVTHEYAGVAFSSAAAVVVGGFAYKTANGTVIWGQAGPDGLLQALCIRFESGADPAKLAGLVSFSALSKLVLVDWLGLKIHLLSAS